MKCKDHALQDAEFIDEQVYELLSINRTILIILSIFNIVSIVNIVENRNKQICECCTLLNKESSPQSCVKVQPHQKHNVLRCEPNCHAFLSEERGQEQ